MIESTLCYLENDKQQYLMLHRIKKENDVNHDKWVGVGGKFENGETPQQCLCREVTEETGLTLNSYRYHGIVTFLSNQWESEHMHLFSSGDYSGTLTDCNEGILEWVDKKDVLSLPLWAGDKIFFRLMETQQNFFELTLRYEGDVLTEAVLNGTPLTLSQWMKPQ